MDAQMIAGISIVANIAQIISVIWLLILGARTIPDLIGKRIARKNRNSPTSQGEGAMRNTPSSQKEREGEQEVHQRYVSIVKEWGIPGFAILLTSSIFAFILRATSCNKPLLWYEILIFGLVISAVLVIFTLLSTKFHSIPLPLPSLVSRYLDLWELSLGTILGQV